MKLLTVRVIMKNFIKLDDAKFNAHREKLVFKFIQCMMFLSSLPYDDFKYIYNELLEIALAGETRFIKLCLYSYLKIHDDLHISYFERVPSDMVEGYETETMQFYEKFISTTNGKLRFANFDLSKFPIPSKNVYLTLINLILYRLNNPPHSINDADYVTTLGLLSMARIGAKTYGNLCDIYAHFLSYLELITQIGDPQRARDALEELIIASEYDSLYYCGIIGKFVLAVKQNRNFEALFIIVFALLIIQKFGIIHEHFFYIFQLATAQLFRNIHFYRIAHDIFNNIHVIFKLDNYHSQQVCNSAFWCRILDRDKTVIQDVENSLYANLENILIYGSISSRPWIALLCGIRDIFHYDSLSLKNFLTIFNRTMSQSGATQFYDSIGCGEDLRQSLIININNIYKSRRSDDIAAHLKSIEPIVNKALKIGLDNCDPELLLMAIFGRTLPFPVQKLEGANGGLIMIKACEYANENIFIEDICNKFNDFSIDNNILLLSSFESSVFCIAYIDGKKIIYKDICLKDDIDLWTSNYLLKLGFHESRKRNGLIEGYEVFWQEESDKIRNSLPSFILDEISINNKCLVFLDVNILKFPINLIRDRSGYISSRYPVTIMMPSLLQRNKYCHSSNPQISLYYSDQQDLTIAMGIELIRPEIEQYIIKSEDENKMNNPNIAIFIGHGNREDNKFKGISFGLNNILLPYEFARICSSEVIVLFVCHAGFSSNMYLNIDSFSLAKELISHGARHVIAPLWPLNIILTKPWIKNFIQHIVEGKSIGESCFFANTKLKEIFKIESAWAAMHHYCG